MGQTVKPFKVNVVVKAHGLSAAADSMHSGRIPEETEMLLACYFERAAIVRSTIYWLAYCTPSSSAYLL